MRLQINFGKLEQKPAVMGIQKFIYECISSSDSRYAEKLHNEGIVFKKSTFTKSIKPFVFSHPYITEHGDCCIKVSSINPEFIFHFMNGCNKKESELVPVDVKPSLAPDPMFNEKGITSREMFMLSPVVIESKEKGVYLTDPTTDEFQRIMRENLIDKYTALRGSRPENDFCKLTFPVGITPKAKIYKGKTIPCLLDRFKFSVSEELFEAAYECGLGQKNGLGFGMIEMSDKNTIPVAKNA